MCLDNTGDISRSGTAISVNIAWLKPDGVTGSEKHGMVMMMLAMFAAREESRKRRGNVEEEPHSSLLLPCFPFSLCSLCGVPDHES